MTARLKDIPVARAHSLLAENAVLVDVREPNELAMLRIPGAMPLPLSQLARGADPGLPQDRPVIFLCASGARTTRYGSALAALAGGDAYNMTGGIMAWHRAGYPTESG